MNDNVKKIHEASMMILQKTGMKFCHPDAVQILKNHGIRTDGDVAYFTEKQIMDWVKKAPSVAPLYASDSRYDMQIGGNRRYNGPCGGATFIMDKDGQTRHALFSDFIKLIKLFEGNPSYCLNGGLACQPDDIPTDSYITLLALASMLHTQKCIFAAAGDYESMETLIQMACIRFAVTAEELKALGVIDGIIPEPRPADMEQADHIAEEMKTIISHFLKKYETCTPEENASLRYARFRKF